MKYSEARSGRVFVIRLEDGDIVHREIEKFAEEKSINAASMIILGGADMGSELIVGPEDGGSSPVVPMVHKLTNVHEVVGTGTLFPDDDGKPVLHMHIAGGRNDSTITGCIRNGLKVWKVMEVILTELNDSTGVRILDSESGFKLLKP